jgi:hypothetical protein
MKIQKKFVLFSILSCIIFYGSKYHLEELEVMVNNAIEDRPTRVENMFYDYILKRLVILSSSKETGQEELWGWDKGQWKKISSAGPSVREISGSSYDVNRKRFVLYGGMGTTNREDRRGDTWEWDGRNWQDVTDPKIGTRDHHSMAYDEGRKRTVVFGGVKKDDNLESDTWEWDGKKWTEVATNGPTGRVHFPMVYDSKNKQVVLFGGLGEGYKKLNDTWVWNGKKWKEIKVGGPINRTHHRMAFDSNSGVTVLFGGLKFGNPADALDDTWIFNGTEWKEIKTKGPGRRSGHVMAYDPEKRKIILYGGGYYDGDVSTNYNDTWEWDGEKWIQVQ